MVLKPADLDDVEAVFRILSAPEVARWWPGETLESCGEMLGSPPPGTQSFVVERDGVTVGFIQCTEEAEPDYRHAGIDLALHPDSQGQGLGTDAVRALARHLIHDRGHHRVTMDPAASNGRAIRCYEKVGFRRVGILRQYERGADGTWHDGLLMDLLANEILEAGDSHEEWSTG